MHWHNPSAYVEMDKPLLTKIMNHKLPQLQGISKWRQMIIHAYSKKMDDNDELYELFKTTHGNFGVQVLKKLWDPNT
jgi:hypothetical protein